MARVAAGLHSPGPSGAWKAKVTEVEYLCLYDPISWPSSARAAGMMPKGCAVTKP